MKKTYLFGLLFLLTTTGILVAKTPEHEVRWLKTVAENSKIDPSSPEIKQNIDKLKELRTTRLMYLQNPNKITAIRTLREIHKQEIEIVNKLNNRILPVANTTEARFKAPTINETKPLRFSTKEPVAPMKVGAGVMRHKLDSFVVEDKNAEQWMKQHKMAFSYNSRGQVTETMSFDSDPQQAWHGTEKAFFTYDDMGRMTGREMQRWNSEVSKWYVEMKMTVTFSANDEMASFEMYQDEYDPGKGEFVLVGMEKAEVTFDANGNINQVTYYLWNYETGTWLQHMLMQMRIEGDLELMFASYVWNVEANKWIGEWKFEHEPLPEYGMMKSTYYHWNEVTNVWVVNSKEEIVVGQDAFGVHFTITNYETDYETNLFHPSRKDKYSKPFGNDYLNEDNYGLIEIWSWDFQTNDWKNKSKQENTFDTYGNITNKMLREWIPNNITGVYDWVLIYGAVNTINEIHKIGLSVESHYIFNPASQNYDLVSKKQFSYTYILVSGSYLMNQRSTSEIDPGGTEWKNTERYDATYFDSKALKTEINSTWNSGTSDWQPWRRSEFDYNPDMTFALTQTDTWNPNTSSWQLQYRSEIKKDEYERLLKSSYAYWSDILGKVYLQNYVEKAYYGGIEDPRLLLEIEVNSQMNYDGVNFFETTYGYKNEWIYEEVGQIKRLKQINDYNFNRVDGYVPLFTQTGKTVLGFDATHPEALTEEIKYEYDSGSGQWLNSHKGIITYDFTVPRYEMIVPFEDYDPESFVFFSFKPYGYLGHTWNNTTNQWEESDRNMIYFSLHEVSSVNNTNAGKYSIYPNPVKDQLTIESDKQFEKAKLSIFNIEGKLMTQQNIQGKATIDVNTWNPGIYFYQITTSNENIRGKFVRE
jgi:hypothetical protein